MWWQISELINIRYNKYLFSRSRDVACGPTDMEKIILTLMQLFVVNSPGYILCSDTDHMCVLASTNWFSDVTDGNAAWTFVTLSTASLLQRKLAHQ